MTKITKIIISIVVLLLAFFLIDRFIYNEKQSDDTGVKQLGTLTLAGTVTGVDVANMTVDGPGVVTFVTEIGETYNIAVASMGRNMCVAKDDIADVYTIEIGDYVSVRGEGNSEGFITPCMDEGDYLRVEKSTN